MRSGKSRTAFVVLEQRFEAAQGRHMNIKSIWQDLANSAVLAKCSDRAQFRYNRNSSFRDFADLFRVIKT